MPETPRNGAPVSPAADASQAGREQKFVELALKLVPAGDSDQPVFANYAALSLASGVVLMDFGFIEPGVLASLPQVARQGGKLPETVNGKLAVRVALTYEAVHQLKRQLDQLASRAARRDAPEAKG